MKNSEIKKEILGLINVLPLEGDLTDEADEILLKAYDLIEGIDADRK
jgi:hypothetical protein